MSADLSAPPVTVLHAADTLHCPVDVWTFRPWFTSGACPLCGWRAEGVTVARPWVERVDAAWPVFALLFAVSLLMAVLVLAA